MIQEQYTDNRQITTRPSMMSTKTRALMISWVVKAIVLDCAQMLKLLVDRTTPLMKETHGQAMTDMDLLVLENNLQLTEAIEVISPGMSWCSFLEFVLC